MPLYLTGTYTPVAERIMMNAYRFWCDAVHKRKPRAIIEPAYKAFMCAADTNMDDTRRRRNTLCCSYDGEHGHVIYWAQALALAITYSPFLLRCEKGEYSCWLTQEE